MDGLHNQTPIYQVSHQNVRGGFAACGISLSLNLLSRCGLLIFDSVRSLLSCLINCLPLQHDLRNAVDGEILLLLPRVFQHPRTLTMNAQQTQAEWMPRADEPAISSFYCG